MENIQVGNRQTKQQEPSEELHMTVSPICERDGHKLAYVSFTDGIRTAEGEIPECKITKNEGFSDSEAMQLELYMKGELATLKRMAASVNVADAFMGKRSNP